MIETYDVTVMRMRSNTDVNPSVEAQVAALCKGQMQNLDLKNLAEDVAGWATSQECALRNLRVLLLHLLQGDVSGRPPIPKLAKHKHPGAGRRR